MEEQNPSFYALIPAIVRYNENICPNAKLLYGELTALTNQKGYCYAGNEYFAKLYKVTIKTASRWIGELEKEGFIRRELVYNEKGEVQERKIYTIHDYLENKKETPPLLKGDPLPKKEEYNNTSFNNTLNINTSMPVDKSTDVKMVINHYKTLKNLPQPKKITSVRESSVNARIKDFGLEEVIDLLTRFNDSEFVAKYHREERKFMSFDWIFSPTKFTKLAEGAYFWMDNKKEIPIKSIEEEMEDLFS